MICEIIRKPGEPGSGGSRDAFAPGVRYVCSKAMRIELRNLASTKWEEAADEMRLTSELSARVQKPFYHLVLSWHEHERPTDEQMVTAMEHLLQKLGLGEHQAVIGSHGDTLRQHIHAVINTVHPITGKVWSKSNDQQKAELACRQIEIDQGWTHDRGRFAFEVLEQDGKKIVLLLPDQEGWEQKKRNRLAGRRRHTPGHIAFQKHHGFEGFGQDIPPALRDRFEQIVAAAQDWNGLHEELRKIGLRYQKFGSGARIQLIGSDEYTKASSFGQAFSIAKMQQRFGKFRPPEEEYHEDLLAEPAGVASITGTMSKEDAKAAKAASFKLTLLRRIYTSLHLDDQVAREIHFVELDRIPPRITFKDHTSVVDHGAKISTSATTETNIKAMVAMATAKGWSGVVPSGPPEFVRRIAIEAARAGLPVSGVPRDVQILADEILEQQRKKQRRLEQEADAALNDHLVASAEREAAVENNMTDAAREAAREILGNDRPRQAPARPRVPAPQPAPDAARKDPGGKRRIQRQLRENDWAELDEMKRLDIGLIAELGGWADVSRTHPDSADRLGKRYRIYARGGDTVKASLVEGKWLWTSNKSGRSGSVIELWLHDNPGKTLGDARAALRVMGTAARRTAPARPFDVSAGPADHTEARRRWEEAPHIDAAGGNYAVDRGISRHTLARFDDQVRAGVYGGIYFAHRNPETGDIQGFEQRWQKDGRKNVARFAKGGRKTVSVLGDPANARRMLVVEGGLDALALAELEARADTIYVSTGGGFGQMTEEALRLLAEGREVFAAFDNDAAGDLMCSKLQAFLPTAARLAPPSRVGTSKKICKDWLDVLNAPKAGAPTQHPELGTPRSDVPDPSLEMAQADTDTGRQADDSWGVGPI